MHLAIDYIPMKVYWEFINSEAAEEKGEDLSVYLKEWEDWAADELQLWKRDVVICGMVINEKY